MRCPVCGTITAVYDICDNCNGRIREKRILMVVQNEMTLKEAKEAYAKGLPIR